MDVRIVFDPFGENLLLTQGLPDDFDPFNHHSLMPALREAFWRAREEPYRFEEATVWVRPMVTEVRASSLAAAVEALEEVGRIPLEVRHAADA